MSLIVFGYCSCIIVTSCLVIGVDDDVRLRNAVNDWSSVDCFVWLYIRAYTTPLAETRLFVLTPILWLERFERFLLVETENLSIHLSGIKPRKDCPPPLLRGSAVDDAQHLVTSLGAWREGHTHEGQMEKWAGAIQNTMHAQ